MRHRLVALTAAFGLAAGLVVAAPAANAESSKWDLVFKQDAPVSLDRIVIDGVLVERVYEAVLRDESGRKVGMLYISNRDMGAKVGADSQMRFRTLVFEFKDGTVLAQGASRYENPFPGFLPRGKSFVIPITGGTGKYMGVTGELKSVHLGSGGHRQFMRFAD